MIALLALLVTAPLDDVVRELPKLDQARRGNLPIVTPLLKRLGPSALLPMLEALSRPAPKGLSVTAARGYRLSLIEATGMLRDARAEPTLFAILDSARDFDTARITAEAIGRIGSDAALAKLTAAADGPQREGVLAGLGHCRRAGAAALLAGALDGSLAPLPAKRVIRALGNVGNAAAWKLASDRREEASARATAADALVRAFVTYGDEELRTAASNAIMVVDDPTTPALIARTRLLVDDATARALDALSARFMDNPAR